MNLVLVLHAHLPWGHLAEENDSAARWALEASVDCYQPLLDALERLATDAVPFRITVSVSPPLAAMWSSPLFGPRLARFVEAEKVKYQKVPAQYAALASGVTSSSRYFGGIIGALAAGLVLVEASEAAAARLFLILAASGIAAAVVGTRLPGARGTTGSLGNRGPRGAGI